jgi:Family of unknown function (DUF6022)
MTVPRSLEGGDASISTIAAFVSQYLHGRWRRVLRDNRESLERVFETAGEVAYGRYWTLLTRPLREQFTMAGLRTDPRFPGNFRHSVEEWGPLEDRKRCMWYVVRAADSASPLGTLVLGSFHDHTRFRVPRAPEALALEATDADAIVEFLLGGGIDRPRRSARSSRY